jgi:hypothetical protein
MAQAEEVKEVSIGTVDMREYKAARDKGVVTVEQKVAPLEEVEEKEEVVGDPEEKPEGEKPKSKGGGFQKKIDRLIKHNATLEEKLAAAEKEREELRVKASGAKPAAETKTEGEAEPKLEDFKTHEEWVKATAKWEIRQELKAQKESEHKEAEAAAQKEVFDAYNSKVSEARAKYDDFDEVVGNPKLQIPMNVQLAIIEMENGPDVAYHLGKNPELCTELQEMSALRAIGKIFRVGEELGGGTKNEKAEEAEEKPEEKAPKIVSKAPAPFKPVGSGNTKSTVALDKMDMKSFKAARAAGRVS